LQIVEELRGTLLYGEEISLLGEGGKLLYDIDFEDLLPRPCQEIGLVQGRTLTVVDEDEDSNRVNLEFLISEGPKFRFPSVEEIPRKPPPRKEEGRDVVENGVDMENGVLRKRAREDDGEAVFRKKARVAVENDGEHEIFIIEDEDDDTIMLD